MTAFLVAMFALWLIGSGMIIGRWSAGASQHDGLTCTEAQEIIDHNRNKNNQP